MSSLLSMQGQDCRLSSHCSRGSGESMRVAQELGKSGWDNG